MFNLWCSCCGLFEPIEVVEVCDVEIGISVVVDGVVDGIGVGIGGRCCSLSANVVNRSSNIDWNVDETSGLTVVVVIDVVVDDDDDDVVSVGSEEVDCVVVTI